MPSIDVFASQAEIVSLVELLLDQGWQFIPDINYESPSPDVISDLGPLLTLAKDNPTFYVLRQDLLQSPIKLREVTSEQKHFFYIDPRVGGPTLFLYWGREYSKEDRSYLGSTNIGFYPWHKNSLTLEREIPSKDFRKFFVAFAKALKQQRRKIKPGVREYWISVDVEKRVREGLLLIGLEHFTPSQILDSDA